MNKRNTGPQYGDMVELMNTYKETDCHEAATKLLHAYESIVKMSARKVSHNRPDLYEDLFQVGRMTLLQLFKKFDSTLGHCFEAYAVKSIIGHLKNYLRDKSWYVQVPRRIKEKGLQVQRAIDELTVTLERSPRIDEIAVYLDLGVEETIEILSGSEHYNYVSLDAPISNDEQSVTIGELISDPHDDFAKSEERIDLEVMLVKLMEAERKVLALAYVEGYSQRDIAQRLGISQMSVSRIQKRAIEKLKALYCS